MTTTTTRRWLAIVVVALGASLVVVGCGGGSGSGTDPAGGPADGASGLDGEITVSAAASLTEAFTRIGADFEAANPGTTVTFNFASSGRLAQQIVDGAPVDVFASADEATMATLTDAGLIDGDPTVFARNRLAIVTEPGNPLGITDLGDLADAGVVALCEPSAPCGRFAAQVLTGAGVAIAETSVTRGQNVRSTLIAVAEGDAVAAIVYVTDAAAADDAVSTVAIPPDQNATATYPVGVRRGAAEPRVARAFVEYLASDAAQRVLEEFGFLPPR